MRLSPLYNIYPTCLICQCERNQTVNAQRLAPRLVQTLGILLAILPRAAVRVTLQASHASIFRIGKGNPTQILAETLENIGKFRIILQAGCDRGRFRRAVVLRRLVCRPVFSGVRRGSSGRTVCIPGSS